MRLPILKKSASYGNNITSRNNRTMDNRNIDQLRAEAKDALVHWAKTDKGYFFMKDALGKYFETTGANRSCGNDKDTNLLGRRIAAQRIVMIPHFANR